MKYLRIPLFFSLILFILCFLGSCEQSAQEENNDDLDIAEDTELTEDDMDYGPNNRTSAIPKDVLEVRISDQYGSYLTDSTGRALYIFQADTTLDSNCYDDCAQMWPPYIIDRGILTQGTAAINDDLISTFTRETGELQLSYKGMPLYYYVKDENEGQTLGHDIMGFGAEWYLLNPAGEIIQTE